jgi:hypothetical protein
MKVQEAGIIDAEYNKHVEVDRRYRHHRRSGTPLMMRELGLDILTTCREARLPMSTFKHQVGRSEESVETSHQRHQRRWPQKG